MLQIQWPSQKLSLMPYPTGPLQSNDTFTFHFFIIKHELDLQKRWCVKCKVRTWDLWAGHWGEQVVCLFLFSNSSGLAGDNTLDWGAVQSYVSMLSAFQPISTHQLFNNYFCLSDWRGNFLHLYFLGDINLDHLFTVIPVLVKCNNCAQRQFALLFQLTYLNVNNLFRILWK